MQEASTGTLARVSSDLTLVLISQERPAFLRRALQYYQGFACAVLVVDVSHAPLAVDAFPGVEYFHAPQLGASALQARLDYAVARVRTPYLAILRDDSFALSEGLAASVAFLADHPGYDLCHGYGLLYTAFLNHVEYARSTRRVSDAADAVSPSQRVAAALEQFIPSFDAVTRTARVMQWLAFMPQGTGDGWLELSHGYFLLAGGSAQVLHMPYIVRGADSFTRHYEQALPTLLAAQDAVSSGLRERHAELLAPLVADAHLDAKSAVQWLQQRFEQCARGLHAHRSIDVQFIFQSRWFDALAAPERRFEPTQYVELPFYTQALFDQLESIEFLIHALPAGAAHLGRLEGPWARQRALLETYPNDTPATITNRLWQAMDISPFNPEVALRLAEQLPILNDLASGAGMAAWAARLQAAGVRDRHELLQDTPTGRLLAWLKARTPTAAQASTIGDYLRQHQGGPQIGILLLDLDNDLEQLQVTLDSLLGGSYRNFKIVVFTTGALPVATTARDTLHFVSVTKAHYPEKINQLVQQAEFEWLLLAQVGDQFTPAGLARAALELLKAPECRAVCADEIHRQADGTLEYVFRPGFNLDLLQSVPALLARHWLVRRDVLLEAGGYSVGYRDALEFELLLRIIDKGGMAWLAHLDEPLLTCRAAVLDDNPHERQALVRQLASRGYQALVSSEVPGTYRIEYRHKARPWVSVVLPCQDNLAQLQASLENIRLKTRYTQYEVLVVDNASQDASMLDWLEHTAPADTRVKVLRSEQPVSIPTLYNAASRQAKGEFLVLLDSAAEVVNPNWIESLLNHALRPEVGVVGAKMLSEQGHVSQAGLLLGFDGGVGAAFAGSDKAAHGYLQRLVVDQNYSAVSATCLMIGKALFEAVGGLDDEQFAAALSDVDLCLKVGQNGLLTVWTPYVQVVHPGTVAQPPEALAALRGKWAGHFAHDLAYNRNLAQAGTSFTLGAKSAINWAPLLG